MIILTIHTEFKSYLTQQNINSASKLDDNFEISLFVYYTYSYQGHRKQGVRGTIAMFFQIAFAEHSH